jgi:hypothetical protein
MPTTRKRVSREKNKVAGNLSANDLEHLIDGPLLMFTGETSNFKTLHQTRAAYKKHKKYLLGLVGAGKIYGDRASEIPWGRRFWAFYMFEFEDSHEGHYLEFCKQWSVGNRRVEFEWLRDADLLLPGETEAFERQEVRYAEHMKSLRPGQKVEKKIIDFNPQRKVEKYIKEQNNDE